MKKYVRKGYESYLRFKGTVNILINKFIKLIKKPPNIKSTDETINKIVNNNFSVSRYGDGEFSLMNGESLLFQSYSKELALRLKEIIKSSEQKHIVCIPNIFESIDWCTEKSRSYWARYLKHNLVKIYKFLDIKKEYFDALMTRLYVDHKDKSKSRERFTTLMRLWSGRDVVIVEGAKSRLGVGNNLFEGAKKIERIICPPIDAYSKYNDILTSIKGQDQSKLILIALGPAATVLAYDLAILGYQAVDLGHIDIEYEWFLQGVEEKCPVKNKYIGEIDNGADIEEIYDDKYETEVIYKVI